MAIYHIEETGLFGRVKTSFGLSLNLLVLVYGGGQSGVEPGSPMFCMAYFVFASAYLC